MLNTIREGDILQAGTILECLSSNAGHVVWDGDAFQMRSLECVSFDGLDRTRNLNRLDGVIVNKCIRADAGHAILNDNMFHHQVSPGGIKPDNPGVPVAIHCAGAADGQRTLTVQRPGQVAAVALCAAGAAVHDVCRQRRGRQERRDHQHREHKTEYTFFHPHFLSFHDWSRKI